MNPSQFAKALPNAVNKSTPHLYRDCMRLVNHIGGQSPKGIGMRAMVRSEFRKHSGEMDPDKIEALRAGAVRALSNYLLYESGSKDPAMKQRMAEQISGARGGGRRAGAGMLVPPPNPIAEDRKRLAKADDGDDDGADTRR